MRKLWQDEAWEEYLDWQTQDKKTLKKINRLLTDIDRNGYQCTGKPEPLSGNLAGYWSVHIDEKNRIVFKIDGDSMEIVQKGKEEMTKEERKKRVQEAWKKLKTTSRDSKEFKEVLTTWNKLDTEYLKLYNEEY